MNLLDFDVEKLQPEQIKFLEQLESVWKTYQKNPQSLTQELFLPVHQFILKSIAKEEARLLRSKSPQLEIKRKIQQDFLKTYTHYLNQFPQNQAYPKEIFTFIKMWFSKVIAENTKFSAIKKTA
jgi:hypothetical protein